MSSKSSQPSDHQCQQMTADARRCQLPRMKDHPSFCYIHAQRQQQLLDPRRVAAELLGPFQDLKTANAVNHALGSLFLLVAQNRIPPRQATTLAYIGQLLLQSLDPLQTEIKDAWGYNHRDGTVREVLWQASQTEAPGQLTQATIEASLPPQEEEEEDQAEEEEGDESQQNEEEQEEEESDEEEQDALTSA